MPHINKVLLGALAAVLLLAAAPAAPAAFASGAAAAGTVPDAGTTAQWNQKYAEVNGNMGDFAAVASDGKYHYYVEKTSETRDTLYRYNPATREKKKLADSLTIYNLMISGDWIYFLRDPAQRYKANGYSKDAYDIYKIRKDGTKLSKVSAMTDVTRFMYVDGDWIYFSHWNQDQSLYKMKLNGTSLTRLSSQTGVGIINIWGDSVVFEADYRTIWKVKKDGSGEQEIGPAERSYLAADGQVYILGFDADLSKVSTDGTDYRKGFYQAHIDPYGLDDILLLNRHGGYLYVYQHGDTHIRRIDLSGKNAQKWVKLPANTQGGSLYFAGNWMYYEAIALRNSRVTKRSLYRVPVSSPSRPELVYSASY